MGPTEGWVHQWVFPCCKKAHLPSEAVVTCFYSRNVQWKMVSCCWLLSLFFTGIRLISGLSTQKELVPDDSWIKLLSWKNECITYFLLFGGFFACRKPLFLVLSTNTYHSVARRLHWDSLCVRCTARPVEGTHSCSHMGSVREGSWSLVLPCWPAVLEK